MENIVRAVIVKKDNKYVYVNYFQRVKDSYDLKVADRKYTSREIKNLISNDKTKEIGEFFKNKNVGDVFNF